MKAASVIGLGKIGIPLAVCHVVKGFRVIVVHAAQGRFRR
jgi:UDP-N-acetyl-D-mannosaminuronate dehydrogenase